MHIHFQPLEINKPLVGASMQKLQLTQIFNPAENCQFSAKFQLETTSSVLNSSLNTVEDFDMKCYTSWIPQNVALLCLIPVEIPYTSSTGSSAYFLIDSV